MSSNPIRFDALQPTLAGGMLAAALACALLPACGDDGETDHVTRSIRTEDGGPRDGSLPADAGGDASMLPGFESCEGREAGDACGPKHHCVEGRCLE